MICYVFVYSPKQETLPSDLLYHQFHFHHFLSLRLWDIFTKQSHFWRLGPLNVSGIFHQKRPHSPTLREGGPMDGQGDRTTPDASNLSGLRWFPLICQIETYVSSVFKTRMCWKSFHSWQTVQSHSTLEFVKRSCADMKERCRRLKKHRAVTIRNSYFA